jgi:hypothetical protein
MTFPLMARIPSSHLFSVSSVTTVDPSAQEEMDDEQGKIKKDDRKLVPALGWNMLMQQTQAILSGPL